MGFPPRKPDENDLPGANKPPRHRDRPQNMPSTYPPTSTSFGAQRAQDAASEADAIANAPVKRKAGRPIGSGKRLPDQPIQRRVPKMILIKPNASNAKSYTGKSMAKNKLAHEQPLMRSRIPVPPEPTYNAHMNSDLYIDQQVARVELLMLKGMRSPRLIAQTLQVEERLVVRWMIRVNARWEVSGGGVRLKRYRGEVIARIQMLRNELMVAMGNMRPGSGPDQAGDIRGFVVTVQQLLALEKLDTEIHGLSPNAVAKLNIGDDDANEVLARMARQERMSELASQFGIKAGWIKPVENSLVDIMSADSGVDTIEGLADQEDTTPEEGDEKL